MQLREALKLAAVAKKNEARKVSLLCSFEPLHLKTFLQAHLSRRFPEGAPRVETFGYDQLRSALTATSTTLRHFPAFLCLSWEDLHPALSWRGRGRLEAVDIAGESARLQKELKDWISARSGAETYVAVPPLEWLPLLDPVSPMALGPTALAASKNMSSLAETLGVLGARVLGAAGRELNYRDLLQAGFPLTLQDADSLAERFVKAAFPATTRKKALVLDLDETLWSGTIGEGGPEGVACRAEGKGFPHYVLQKFAAKLKAEGVLLAFCSKNNPGDVLPHFDGLDMPLKLSDFSSTRCNWEPKSANLQAIAQELNIGVDSLVLVDDNEAELAEVRQNAPGTTALPTPKDGAGWQRLFVELQELFGAWRVSEEDQLRAASLKARPASSAGGEGYLKDLELKISIDRDAFKNPRCLELINKTNQFNLTGERLSSAEWLSLAQSPDAFCLSAKLKDRFGDFGTVGVIAGSSNGTALVVRHFVVSCRAFGRCVETVLLGELAKDARPWLKGPFKRNGKNEPAERFLIRMGAAGLENGEWKLESAKIREALAQALSQTAAEVA